MDKMGYKSLINDHGLSDIQNDDDLDQITQFLTHIGTILHYSDPSNKLDKLFFVDSPWLCKIISNTVKVTETDPCIINGIKNINSISFVLHNNNFPLQYFDHCIALLDRFEIALVVEESKIFIPSQLSTMQPKVLSASRLYDHIPYTWYILFDSNTAAPIGFWNQLLSRIIQSVSKIKSILNSKIIKEDCTNENSCARMMECNLLSHLKLSSDPSTCPQYNSEFSGTKLRTFHWSTGIFYEDDEVFVILQSTTFLKEEGIMITAAPNDEGRFIFCLIMDLIMSLLQECYRGAIIQKNSPCSDCILYGSNHSPFSLKWSMFASFM